MKPSAGNSIDPKNYIYHSLSQALNSNAVFPPRNEKYHDFFDIVIINPEGPKATMLQQTDVNLLEVLTDAEKEQIKAHLETCIHKEDKHLTSINDWRAQGNIPLQNGLGSLSPQVSFSSGQVVDLAIVDAKTTRVKYRITSAIEQFIFKYFAKLVASALGRHVKNRFFIGVITGITQGKVDIISEQVRDVTCSASVESVPPVEGHATVQGTIQNRRQLYGNGIIGVDMVCFLIKSIPDTCEYKISRGIRVLQIDDEFKRRRKYLRAGRGMFSIMGLTMTSEHLFSACHITSSTDLNLDEEMKKDYLAITKAFGKLLGRVHLMRENEELGLIAKCGGLIGRDFWARDILYKPPKVWDPEEESPDVSPYLITTEIEGLNEINEDDRFPWLQTMSTATDADPSTEQPEMIFA